MRSPKTYEAWKVTMESSHILKLPLRQLAVCLYTYLLFKTFFGHSSPCNPFVLFTVLGSVGSCPPASCDGADVAAGVDVSQIVQLHEESFKSGKAFVPWVLPALPCGWLKKVLFIHRAQAREGSSLYGATSHSSKSGAGGWGEVLLKRCPIYCSSAHMEVGAAH